MDSADSFMNWGFNPKMMKGGEYFIISKSLLNTDDWPYTIMGNNYIFPKEEFVKYMGIGSGRGMKLEEFARMTGISIYVLRNLHWRNAVRACKTYGDMGLEGDGLEDIIKWTNELDFEQWVETGWSEGIQDRAWRQVIEGNDSAYKIDFAISKDWISLSIGEQPSWGDPPWAMHYVIERVAI